MEIYFNLFKVKFEKLLELLREDESIKIGSKNTVNVFINLEPIFLLMSNPRVNEYIKANPKSAQKEFIACIINLAAHYKWFFCKHKILPRIYLYYPSLISKDGKNLIHNNDYRAYYRHKFLNDTNNFPLSKLIISSIEFIQVILEYIQGVYFIDSNNIENSVIPYVIHEDNNDNSINFIVSTSIYDLQYVNFGYHIIIPKRDDSVVLNKKNVIPYLIQEKKYQYNYSFGPTFLPFILSIVGSKSRNIYKVKGLSFKSIFKMIQTAIDAKLLSNNISNIYMILDIIKKPIREQIIKNYYCTDVLHQYNQLNKKDIHDIISQLKDKFDNTSLKKINDKYFENYPIMLMEITSNPHDRKIVKF